MQIILTAHSTGTVQRCPPQSLEQHNEFPSQSSLLLHSIAHDPAPVTLGQVRLAATRSCDPVS